MRTLILKLISELQRQKPGDYARIYQEIAIPGHAYMEADNPWWNSEQAIALYEFLENQFSFEELSAMEIIPKCDH